MDEKTNFEALYKISYGLYIVCSGNNKKGNGFISNTVFQVTSEPAKFASCCSKDNLTCEFIKEFGAFSVSVLHQDASSEIIGKFGYKSGKEIDKMADIKIKYGITGVPIVLNDAIAFFECNVVEKYDVGTHIMFIGELVNAQIVDDTKEPMTYSYYRRVRKGIAPKNAPTYISRSKLQSGLQDRPSGKFRCTCCGYIYDESAESIKFKDLPESWVCPVCGCEKADFEAIE